MNYNTFINKFGIYFSDQYKKAIKLMYRRNKQKYAWLVVHFLGYTMTLTPSQYQLEYAANVCCQLIDLMQN